MLLKDGFEGSVQLGTWICGLRIRTNAKKKKKKGKKKHKKNANEKDFLLYFRETYHFQVF